MAIVYDLWWCKSRLTLCKNLETYRRSNCKNNDRSGVELLGHRKRNREGAVLSPYLSPKKRVSERRKKGPRKQPRRCGRAKFARPNNAKTRPCM
jgi:hypothetical protein